MVDNIEGMSADDIPDLLPSLPTSAEGRVVSPASYVKKVNLPLSYYWEKG